MSKLRIKRSLKDKLFLVDIENTQNLYEKHFSVMGSTGNIYKIKINLENSNCNCPDFLFRQDYCKHIYFVFLKVLNANKKDLEYNLDDSFLLNLFDNLNYITHHLYASDELREVYINELKKDSVNEDNNLGIKVQKKDDSCPICMDELENNEAIDYCKYGCGKSLHSECFKMWSSKNKGNKPRCVFCRTDWEFNINQGNGNSNDFIEYFNVLKASNNSLPSRPRNYNYFFIRGKERGKRRRNTSYRRYFQTSSEEGSSSEERSSIEDNQNDSSSIENLSNIEENEDNQVYKG